VQVKLRLQLATARLAARQMLLQRGHLLIRQLAVGDKNYILLRLFALHCSTSTGLKELPLQNAFFGSVPSARLVF
jgi:hypothetical protein